MDESDKVDNMLQDQGVNPAEVPDEDRAALKDEIDNSSQDEVDLRVAY